MNVQERNVINAAIALVRAQGARDYDRLREARAHDRLRAAVLALEVCKKADRDKDKHKACCQIVDLEDVRRRLR